MLVISAALATPSSAQVLSIDVGERPGPGPTQAGFDEFLIDNVGGDTAVQTGDITRSFSGGIDVTIQSVGSTGYDDRSRTEPVNDGAFTEASLLQDFIFSRNGSGGGVNVHVSGLAPYGVYDASLWSFDTSSNDPRISDWRANGQLVVSDYTFNGLDVPPSPPSNDTYRRDFQFAANGAGEVTIRGTQDTKNSDFGVFLNALQISDQQGVLPIVPDPVLRVDFGSGPAMDGFTQMNLAASGTAVDGKTVSIGPVGQYEQQRYDVFVNFWDASGSNDWQVMGGLAADALNQFTIRNSIDTGITSGDRILYRAFLGSVPADGAGEIKVYIDDVPGTTAGIDRSWLDSVSYAPSETGSPLTNVELNDTTTVETVAGDGVWHDTASGAPNWFFRSGFDGTFGGVWQALGGDFDALTVTIDGLGSTIGSPTAVTLAERSRTSPTDGGLFGSQELLRDFIFASNGDLDTSGLDVTVEDLVPDAEYYVTVWSYDVASTPVRSSDWYANGSLVVENYQFDGAFGPANDGDNAFSFFATADGAGNLVIAGRVGAESSGASGRPNVFINALQIQAVVPEPGSFTLGLIGLIGAGCIAGRKRRPGDRT
jgi:hypothetical protein